jgi:3-hydroxyisobutyrate dehydrogenase-like beta-hydroxyacid dehydrogenase
LIVADVAIIGVGLVGSALADRFIAAGWSVAGFDRRPETLGVPGLTAADSARSAAASAPLVVLSLPDSDVVDAVIRDIEPVLRGRIVIDTTTGDPDRMEALGERLHAAGIAYVDATIAGSSRQVRDGTVVVMAGGDADTVRQCERLFARFAAKWFHIGPRGAGARMKLVVNLVLGLNRAVLAEGLAFANASGLDATLALEVLRSGAAYSRAMDVKGPKMLAGDFTPEARLSQHHKDVRLILDAAKRAGMELPLSQVHAALLRKLEDRGFGDEDNSAIIRAMRNASAR